MTLNPNRSKFPALFGIIISVIAALCAVSAISLVTAKANEGNKPVKIVVLGDSLVAGYQLQPGEGFPEVLQKRLDPEAKKVTFINAGVSGDTTSGGLSRLNWSVPDDVDGVILELGANDALRGLKPETTKANLKTMITDLNERGIKVLLCGMLAPPNMGSDYETEFNAIYSDLAKSHDLAFYPFFLKGVAAEPELNLADGMHPNTEGVEKIVEQIMPLIQTFIADIKSNRN